MALRMVALGRAKDGCWFARKGIPEDVRDPYARLFGVRREAHLRLPRDTPHHEAKTRCAEWMAEVETRIATIRAQRDGEGQPLTWKDAVALAGRWYLWFVAQYEDDPGSQKRWQALGDQLIWEVIYPHAPDSYHENPEADPEWEWAKKPEVREAIRPQVAEEARVARFLANEGVVLSKAAYALFVDAVSDNLYPAIRLLGRRAAGDYSPDPTPKSFPVFTGGAKRGSSGSTCWELFEGYVTSTRRAPQTVSRWRAVFLQMQKDFATAEEISEEKARSWIAGLVTEGRSAYTVREVWLSASRTVFGWAVRHKHISKNPFSDVHVDVPRKRRLRETKAFRDEEAAVVLKAALAYSAPRTIQERARRWVPWLCAYSGARAGEITQMRGADIQRRSGLYVMVITPEAGSTKTHTARVVPIHEHVIEQGFLRFVEQCGAGPLFYNPREGEPEQFDPLKPRRSRAATTRAHLSDWVRELGITDPELKPTHAWRETFKQIASRVGIIEQVHDEITGHSQKTIGRGYGRPTVEDMAEALKKFPRYRLDRPLAAEASP